MVPIVSQNLGYCTKSKRKGPTSQTCRTRAHESIWGWDGDLEVIRIEWIVEIMSEGFHT